MVVLSSPVIRATVDLRSEASFFYHSARAAKKLVIREYLYLIHIFFTRIVYRSNKVTIPVLE